LAQASRAFPPHSGRAAASGQRPPSVREGPTTDPLPPGSRLRKPSCTPVERATLPAAVQQPGYTRVFFIRYHLVLYVQLYAHLARGHLLARRIARVHQRGRVLVRHAVPGRHHHLSFGHRLARVAQARVARGAIQPDPRARGVDGVAAPLHLPGGAHLRCAQRRTTRLGKHPGLFLIID
jgi:hypothetical protein